MPVLRLFAAAREAAGTASVEVPGETVDEVLAAARARFGPALGTVIDSSKVWRNGEPASGDDPVGPSDEVAVLPPVSGGSGGGNRPGRPTFSPAEPPPPAKPAPAPRRSPSAEAAAARRADGPPRRRPDGSEPPRRRPDAARRPDGSETPRRARPDAARRPDGSETPRRPRPDAARRPDGSETPRRPRPDAARRPDGSETPRRATPKPTTAPTPTPRKVAGAPTRRGPAPAPDLRKRRVVTSTPPPLEPGVLTRTAAPTGKPLEPVETDGGTGTATRLARLRSVGVPVTGTITVRGKERQVSGRRVRRTELGRRYAPVYDTDGPKVTFGVLWFIAVMGSVALGWWALTFVIAVACGWAAMEAADRWRERGVAADPWTAALGAAVVAAAGAAGGTYAGAAILLVVLASVGRMALTSIGRDHVLSAAGNTVGCAIPFGLAGATIVLANDLEIGAVVALLLFVFAYDAGDYLIGSGSSNSVEGPLTGIVTIAVVAMAVAVLGIPPFEGTPAYTFAAIAAVGCPLGQLAASAILPAADAHAPTVRRLDTLLLLAPIWFLAVDVYMASR